MKKEIPVKLKFEVGEKVVVCNSSSYFCGSEYCPNKNDFTFATVTAVNADDSVIIDGKYKYRQAYETRSGELEVFDYFRIDKAPKNDYFFDHKEYNGTYSKVHERALFWGPSYLFKYSKDWQVKADAIEVGATRLAEVEHAREEREAREAEARRPHIEAYNATIKPLEEAMAKAWKEHICANCINNREGHCTQWNHDIATSHTRDCTAFEAEIPNN